MDTNKSRKRIVIICIAVAVIVAAAGLALHAGSASFSKATSGYLADTAGAIETDSRDNLHNSFPFSSATRSLLKTSRVMLQNSDYLKDANASAPPVVVGEEEQRLIIDTLAEEFPEDAAPWYNGYAGKCEQWVCDVYQKAGLPTIGSCCASRSRDERAVKEGDIPAGAMIYSGDDYKSGYRCEICGRDPGHVAIYLGDDRIAGSQPEYIMSLTEFKKTYGYGGWSYSGNVCN